MHQQIISNSNPQENNSNYSFSNQQFISDRQQQDSNYYKSVTFSDQKNQQIANKNKKQLLSTQLYSKKQYPQIKLECSQGKSYKLLCLYKSCKSNNHFLCSNQNCKCQKSHTKKCYYKKINDWIKEIDQKLSLTKINKLRKQAQFVFNNIIKRIHQYLKNMINQIEKIKYIQISDIQMKLYKIMTGINKQQLKFLQKHEILILNEILSADHNIKNISNPINQIDKKLFKQCQSAINIFNTKCEKEMTNTKHKIQGIINKFKNQKNNYQFCIAKSNYILNQSSILKTRDHIYNLINYFSFKNVIKLQLVFKASFQKFDIHKYYKKCGKLKNTLILCKTNEKKIIGGFTPLSFNPIRNRNQFTEDFQQQSFIFSLDNNDKFSYRLPNQAIYRTSYKDYIRFGLNQLLISNYSNVNFCKASLIQHAYINKKYNQSNKSYLKFHGNQTSEFTTKQWEVFQVHFQ